MQQVLQTAPPTVQIIVGKHSVDAPHGTAAVITAALQEAGYGGTWKSMLGGFVKGTRHTLPFRVRSVEGRSITVRVHPGGNGTCTEHRLIVPHALNPEEVFATLRQQQDSSREAVASTQPQSDAPQLEEEPLESTANVSLTDVMAIPTLTDMLLFDLYERDVKGFSASAFDGTVALLTDAPADLNLCNDARAKLVKAGLIESTYHDGVAYRLTRTALERIRVNPSLPGSDDVALAVGETILKLQADAVGYFALEDRRDHLVAQQEDLLRQQAGVSGELKVVEDHLKSHPGKEAASKVRAMKALANIKD